MSHYKYDYNEIEYLTNYKWGKFSVFDCNIYQMDLKNSKENTFIDGVKYNICIVNRYNSNEYPKFNLFVLKNYDFDKEFTNKQIIVSSEWFDTITVELEVNKIYVYVIYFENGNFAQYTFNTKLSRSPVIFGEYTLLGKSDVALKLFCNKNFIWTLLKSNNKEEITGKFGIELIDNQKYLCLYIGDEKTVFENIGLTLLLDFTKTTFDVDSYGIEYI